MSFAQTPWILQGKTKGKDCVPKARNLIAQAVQEWNCWVSAGWGATLTEHEVMKETFTSAGTGSSSEAVQ